MFLVRLIDVFVGILEFVFRSDKRAQGSSPAVLGTAGIVTLLVLMLVALGVPALTYRAQTSPYTAELANAAGLTTADPVLVAGVPAGRIESITLAGDRVRVAFRLDNDQPLGNQTRAGVALRTVLGKRYLAISPAGSGEVGPARTIPRERTDTPYSLDDISAASLNSATEIDPEIIRSMMTTMQEITPDARAVEQSLRGAVGAASVISGAGTQFDQMLVLTKNLATLTANQADSITDALSGAQALVQTLVVRRVLITRMADNLRVILAQMASTFPQIGINELTRNTLAVTTTLKENVANIDAILITLPPALRTITDSTGNGNWADVASPSAVIPDNMLCVLGVMQGCR